jgi:hypothetical protein
MAPKLSNTVYKDSVTAEQQSLLENCSTKTQLLIRSFALNQPSIGLERNFGIGLKT